MNKLMQFALAILLALACTVPASADNRRPDHNHPSYRHDSPRIGRPSFSSHRPYHSNRYHPERNFRYRNNGYRIGGYRPVRPLFHISWRFGRKPNTPAECLKDVSKTNRKEGLGMSEEGMRSYCLGIMHQPEPEPERFLRSSADEEREERYIAPEPTPAPIVRATPPREPASPTKLYRLPASTPSNPGCCTTVEDVTEDETCVYNRSTTHKYIIMWDGNVSVVIKASTPSTPNKTWPLSVIKKGDPGMPFWKPGAKLTFKRVD